MSGHRIVNTWLSCCCWQVVSTGRKVKEAGCLSSELWRSSYNRQQRAKRQDRCLMHFQKWRGDLGRRNGISYSEKGIENVENHLACWCWLLQGGVCYCIFTVMWGRVSLRRVKIAAAGLRWVITCHGDHGMAWSQECLTSYPAQTILSKRLICQGFCVEVGLTSMGTVWVCTLPMKPHVSGGLQGRVHKEPGGLWICSYLFR